MTDKPKPFDDPSPIVQTYWAIMLFGAAIIAIVALGALCLGPTLGLAVKLYTDISGG